MAAFEIMAAIRHHKFPVCTRMALEQLATIYLRGGVASIPGLASNGDDIEEQIVAEFIIFKNTKKVLLSYGLYIFILLAQFDHFRNSLPP